MTRHFVPWAAMALAAVAGCSDDENADVSGADDLLARVRAQNYRSWPSPPGYENGPLLSSAPHSTHTRPFLNPVIVDALAGPALSAWPQGSIVVKEGTDDGGALAIIAIMEKREDGWYWAEYDATDDTATFSGHPSTCLDCHGMSSQDFTWILALPTGS